MTLKQTIGLVILVVLIILSIFLFSGRKNDKTKNSHEQSSKTANVQQIETERIHKLSEHEETYSIPEGYRAEFSERKGRLYYLRIDGKEVIVGDGVYDEFGNKQITYSLRRHESDDTENTVTVYFKPL